ncbi:MAG: exodeoxyribonuclease V subunit alpha [Betaproteobacteria bacterium]
MNETTQVAVTEEDRLTDIDRHFGRFLVRLAGRDDVNVLAAAMLVSRATGNGDVCVDLARYAGRPLPEYGFTAPPVEQWTATLRKCPVVGEPGEFRPLVLDQAGRLYLYRYWEYEKRLAESLLARAEDAEDVDIDLLRAGLGRLFPDPADVEQKRAAAMAVLRRFCVISGGPGTGKTFTVVKILALLAEQARGRKLAVGLAAPTGKAAARVQEAIREAVRRMSIGGAVGAAIPDTASTLHRLLGARPDSVYYRHDREHPLALDVLVVDEASMADLALMAKLVDALPERARLVLLGDKDQLASVEAGAVLGDICAGSGISERFAERLALLTGLPALSEAIPAPASPLGDSIALLQRSYRFGTDSGIGKLAALVNNGSGAAALDVLKSGKQRDIVWHPAGARELRAFLSTRAVERLAAYLDRVASGAAPGEIFDAFNAFRVLCAHRGGPAGAVSVNRMIEAALEEKNLIDTRETWYAGRPVMVTRNDYNVRLFNGDVGITLPDADAGGRLKVYFPAPDGGMRKLMPVRLPEHESVYAMTVHKAQGSEFGHVLMILPDETSRIMSRELIYTGITRARAGVEIRGAESVLLQSIERRLARASALRQRLWETR